MAPGPAPIRATVANQQKLELSYTKQNGNISPPSPNRKVAMLVLNPAALAGLAAVITALSALI
jgi:hypothetical protein